MFFKTILVLSLAIFITESSSKYAISPQKDVPNTQKLNHVNFYTTSIPEFEPTYEQESIIKSMLANKPETNPMSYGSIQYAPLALKSEDQAFYEEKQLNAKVTVPVGYNGNTFANTYLVREQIKKNNIEPRLVESENNNEHVQESVIFGHNIQVPQSRNPYLAYNILNSGDNGYTTEDTKNQGNFVNSYLHYHKTEHEIEKTSLRPDDVEFAGHQLITNPSRPGQIYAVLAKQHNVKSNTHKSEKVLSEKESPLIQPQLLHARPYRLHLNVARAYNIAHAPNIKARFINKVPSPSQALRHKLDSTQLLELSEKRTKLISIQNKYINRRT